jgi:hypothetical protein
MMIAKLALPRRTFLRGVGAALALPFLDAMVPALSPIVRTAANPARRLGFVYVPNGMSLNRTVNYWKPQIDDTGAFAFSPILKPLEPFGGYLNVVSGLNHRQAEAFSDGGGDHSRASASWLSGVHPKQAEGADVRAAKTLDQVAADAMGKDTQLPSLELCIDRGDLVGNCDNGYSCVYVNTLSWRSPTTPLPAENNPAIIFERLFGDGGDSANRLRDVQKDRSILDAVSDDVARLTRTLGAADRTRVDEYLDAVREIERRVQRAERQALESPLPSLERPVGVPEDFAEHVKLMFDLQWLALKADVTRITTFMMGRELGGRSYPELGVPVNHHGLSHHRDDVESLARLARINAYHVQLFAYFVDKLRSTPDGDGNLLDHTTLLYGAGLSNSNEHSHIDLPLAVVGGRPLRQSARHTAAAPGTPMMNLLLSLLDRVDVPVEQYGDSTGRLAIEPLAGL